ncbi:GreA/GreB family elongation factor [Croceibacterium sp. TMG7-5b_MA50]|uniref:GreA/GreB family elongation factor n=1 Tax=Croceibacterium sp. TMG7-5b_MA50 TaxID=3121290 RepID=UPI003221B7D5
MSVAFRRESDEEHLEPKFERPLPAGPNIVTRRGLDLIAERIAALQAAVAAAPDTEAAAAPARDLRYWQRRQATAQLAAPPSGTRVEFGTIVSFTLNGRPRTLAIVGDDEADPAAGQISVHAPLARAMLGAEPGEVLPFGGAEDAIAIVAVDLPPAE